MILILSSMFCKACLSELPLVFDDDDDEMASFDTDAGRLLARFVIILAFSGRIPPPLLVILLLLGIYTLLCFETVLRLFKF